MQDADEKNVSKHVYVLLNKNKHACIMSMRDLAILAISRTIIIIIIIIIIKS